jgi:hypothetical protein
LRRKRPRGLSGRGCSRPTWRNRRGRIVLSSRLRNQPSGRPRSSPRERLISGRTAKTTTNWVSRAPRAHPARTPSSSVARAWGRATYRSNSSLPGHPRPLLPPAVGVMKPRAVSLGLESTGIRGMPPGSPQAGSVPLVRPASSHDGFEVGHHQHSNHGDQGTSGVRGLEPRAERIAAAEPGSGRYVCRAALVPSGEHLKPSPGDPSSRWPARSGEQMRNSQYHKSGSRPHRSRSHNRSRSRSWPARG